MRILRISFCFFLEGSASKELKWELERFTKDVLLLSLLRKKKYRFSDDCYSHKFDNYMITYIKKKSRPFSWLFE